MTLRDTILLLENIAAGQPAVNMIVRNDVFKLNACPDALYGAFAWTEGQHSGSIDSWDHDFRFTLFYVDRLTEDGGNMIEVKSAAVDILENILRSIAASEVEVDPWTIRTFSQRFTDLCAGAFATVLIRVPLSTTCAQDFTPIDESQIKII